MSLLGLSNNNKTDGPPGVNRNLLFFDKNSRVEQLAVREIVRVFAPDLRLVFRVGYSICRIYVDRNSFRATRFACLHPLGVNRRI